MELDGAWLLPWSREVPLRWLPTEHSTGGHKWVLPSPLLTLVFPSQAERNLLLEEKVKTLQQENEDLQVRTQNHLVMTR